MPDAKTLWVWRERLKTRDLIGDISAAVSGQLQRAGFLARGGQIIDASIVNAPIQRNRREENEAIKQDRVPDDWNAAKRAQKDVDARWTKKHGKSYYQAVTGVNGCRPALTASWRAASPRSVPLGTAEQPASASRLHTTALRTTLFMTMRHPA